MSDDQFMKMFRYIEEFRNDVNARFETVDKRFDHLEDIIDAYAGKLDTYAQEMAAMQYKMDRLEKYIEVLAKKAGVDLHSIKI